MTQNIPTWTRPFLQDLLQEIPTDLTSLIDIGCGRGIVGALTRIYRTPKRLVGVDIFQEYLEFCEKYRIYDELFQIDLSQTSLPFNDEEFNVATCIETIEHLSKKQGELLLKELSRIANIVIVSTPSFFFKQPKSHTQHNPHQAHMSKWTVKDFKQRGYYVKGVGNLTAYNLVLPIKKLTSKFPRLHQFLIATKKVKTNKQLEK